MMLTDTGFTSTTVAPPKTFDSHTFEIRLPKGTPGAFLDVVPGTLASSAEDAEFLVARSVNRFRVVEVKPDRIVLEAMKPGQPEPPPTAPRK